MAETHHPEAFY